MSEEEIRCTHTISPKVILSPALIHMSLSDLPFLIHRALYDVGPHVVARTASSLLESSPQGLGVCLEAHL